MAGYDRFTNKDTSWLTTSQQLLRSAKSGDYNSKASVAGANGIDKLICSTNVTSENCETKLADNGHESKICNKYFYQDPTSGQLNVCRNPKSNYNPFGKKSKYCRSEALSGSGNYATSGQMSCQKAKDRLNNAKDLLPSARIDPMKTDWTDAEPLIEDENNETHDELPSHRGGTLNKTLKKHKSKRNKSKRNKSKRNKSKRNKSKRNKSKRNKSKRNKNRSRRKYGSGLTQSTQRSNQHVSHRKNNPMSAKIHRKGVLPGHIEGALRETGTVAHGPLVGTQNQSTEYKEDRNIRSGVINMLKHKPKERRGEHMQSHSRLAFSVPKTRKR
jgi:hypothetical protein